MAGLFVPVRGGCTGSPGLATLLAGQWRAFPTLFEQGLVCVETQTMTLWRDHSLTIVMAAIGIILTAYAFAFEEGKWFDLWLGLGQGTLTTAALFFLSRHFREVAKPEDDPHDEV
jgi:hypothetical protein